MNFSITSKDYEDVYLDRDNVNEIVIKSDNVVYDITSITKATLKIGSVTIDSSVSSDAFDWGEGSGILRLKLGQESLNVGTYTAALVLYDASNTHGLYIGSFKIRISSVS